MVTRHRCHTHPIRTCPQFVCFDQPYDRSIFCFPISNVGASRHSPSIGSVLVLRITLCTRLTERNYSMHPAICARACISRHRPDGANSRQPASCASPLHLPSRTFLTACYVSLTVQIVASWIFSGISLCPSKSCSPAWLSSMHRTYALPTSSVVKSLLSKVKRVMHSPMTVVVSFRFQSG